MDFIEELQGSLHNPEALEKLYRQDEKQFRLGFDPLFKEHPYEPVLQVWYQRLNYSPPRSKPGTQILFWWAFPLAVLAAILTRWMWELKPTQFFIDSLLIFPSVFALGTYFSISRNRGWKLQALSVLIFIGLLACFYFLPFLVKEPYYAHKMTVINMLVPVILFFFLGFVYTGMEGFHAAPRLDFIKACGTGLIFSLPLIIGGLLLLWLGIFLFKLLGFEVMELSANISILLVAGAAVPVAAAHMVETQGFMVKNLLARLAKIFTPVLFLLMVAFLVMVGILNQNPFDDRDFLMVFNLALVVILGLTLLSLSDLRGDQIPSFGDVLLFALVIVGMVTCIISLGAVVYRLMVYSVTPVKIALLGFDIAVLGHFFWILWRYVRFLRGKYPITMVQKALAGYLPVYLVGALLGIATLPIL